MSGMTGAGITPRTGPSMAAAIVPMAKEAQRYCKLPSPPTRECSAGRRRVAADCGDRAEMTVRFAVWDQITGAADRFTTA
ncbi:hypothetical protein ACFP51_06260 [Streptomyces pratens]|uniref:Uncharacterized protein n=1 Tax=Streptomyces pratens TaxID=887456 RepID=A0ABW1M4Z2_9ACTN